MYREIELEERERQRLYCPECGDELGAEDYVYTIDGGDSLAGCQHCLVERGAWEWAGMDEYGFCGSERWS